MGWRSHLTIVMLVFGTLTSSRALAEPPSAEALTTEISARLSRIPEMQYIQKRAQELGLRVWLFGGTAASFAHYVRWNLLQESGDARFQADRFDYDYTNIFRSTQDLDIVVDAVPGRSGLDLARRAAELQQSLAREFPHLQGSKSAWEVRPLRSPMGDKEAILNNADFQNQHTDSHSTGLIEVTTPPAGEPGIRDTRDWNAMVPEFLRDVVQGKLHYYYSPDHQRTSRFLKGLNPPIFSVIRFLTKAFQYELAIRSEDLEKIRTVIRDFDPSRDLAQSYAKKWLEKNAKKLIQNAVDVSYATGILDQLGLRTTLRSLGNPSEIDSMAWWLSKEALPPRPVGDGSGKTAAELGISIVAHETRTMLAYEAITRAHTGTPNVLTSRFDAAGEVAKYGDGFYTKQGRAGAVGSGLTIRFEVDPRAREGTDFFLANESTFVVFKNRNALRVIPESLQVGPAEYFELFARGALGTDATDRALIEKFKRKLENRTAGTEGPGALDANTIDTILKVVREQILAPVMNHAFWHAWFESPISSKHPEIVLEFLEKRPTDFLAVEELVTERSFFGFHPSWIELLESPEQTALRKKLKAARSKAILRAGETLDYAQAADSMFWETWAALPESVGRARDFERALAKSKNHGIEAIISIFAKEAHWVNAVPSYVPAPTEHPLLWLLSQCRAAPRLKASANSLTAEEWVRNMASLIQRRHPLPDIAYKLVLTYIDFSRLEKIPVLKTALDTLIHSAGNGSKLTAGETLLVLRRTVMRDASSPYHLQISADLLDAHPEAFSMLPVSVRSSVLSNLVKEGAPRRMETFEKIWRFDAAGVTEALGTPTYNHQLSKSVAPALHWLAKEVRPGVARAFESPKFLTSFFSGPRDGIWTLHYENPVNRPAGITDETKLMITLMSKVPADPETRRVVADAVHAGQISNGANQSQRMATLIGTVLASPEWRQLPETRAWVEEALSSPDVDWKASYALHFSAPNSSWHSQIERFFLALVSDGPVSPEWAPAIHTLMHKTMNLRFREDLEARAFVKPSVACIMKAISR